MKRNKIEEACKKDIRVKKTIKMVLRQMFV